jgi:molybdate transport system substrate-binding protein
MKPVPLYLVVAAIFLDVKGRYAEDIHAAVASNFSEAFRDIVTCFESVSGNRVVLSTGSTGKLYAQIRNGAPFDVFLAADEKRPLLLEKEGIGVPGTRFTYAIGRVVLWSPREGLVDSEGRILLDGAFQHIAVGNPKLAPFGIAAREVLVNLSLWDVLQKKMVYGEDIGQTFNFVASGSTDLGFVSYSHIKRPSHTVTGSLWLVPSSLYSPIVQQAMLLTEGHAARDLLFFITSKESQRIIQNYGYTSP